MRIDAFDAFLNYVVAILVLYTFENMPIQLPNNFLLQICPDGFQSLLDDTATVHLECELDNMS